jgi:hypothetical protein
MIKYKKRFSEGLRYNTDYFEAGKNLKQPKDIMLIIKELKEFTTELQNWKKQGWNEISGDKGEFIPLMK